MSHLSISGAMASIRQLSDSLMDFAEGWRIRCDEVA